MSMNSTNLTNEIIAKYNAIRPEGSGELDPVFVEALASAIVNHITSNAKATGTDTPGGNTHNLSIS